MKKEVAYVVERKYKAIGWSPINGFKKLETAKAQVRASLAFDKDRQEEYKYRIVKATTTREVVE